MRIIPYVYIAAVYTAIYLLVRAAVSIRNKRIDWKRERLHILISRRFASISMRSSTAGSI